MKRFLFALSPYLKGHGFGLAFILFALALQTAMRLALPVGFKLVVDVAVPRNDKHLIVWGGLILTVAWLLQVLAAWGQERVAQGMGLQVLEAIRLKLFRHFCRLPMTEIKRLDSGVLSSTFSTALLHIENGIVRSAHVALFSLANVLLSVVVLIYFDHRLALVTFFGLGLTFWLPKFLARQAGSTADARNQSEADLLSVVQDTFSGFSVARAFYLWTQREAEFKTVLQAFGHAAAASYRSLVAVRLAGAQAAFYLQIAIMLLGGYWVIDGSLTLGSLIGFVALLQNLVGAISHLSNAAPDLIRAAAGMRKVDAFLAIPSLSDEPSGMPDLPRLSQKLELINVSFCYPEKKIWALRDINLQIPAGTRTAIVGPSGSGKSTLVQLLLRFYEPQEGQICIDSCAFQAHSEHSLRAQTGVVPQETFLFATSMLENIRLGRPDASDHEVVQVARAAEIDAVIRALPQGYNTRAVQGGSHLSGGQRQRMALARAILRDPALLILDEATSALDPGMERAIEQTLTRLAKGRTLINVTHRLDNLIDYDQIVVLQHGAVVEQGSHTELLQMEGVYRQLWEKQSGFHISEDGYTATCTPESLARIPLFSMLNADQRRQVVALLQSEYHESGKTLFEAGDTRKKFYILADGMVEILLPEEKLVPKLETGDFFGELSLLDDAPRSAGVRTVRPSLFLTLNDAQFRQLLMLDPTLESAIQKVAAERRSQPADPYETGFW
ncbi:MAG: ATP-binding cassette domain-containing protein [Acidobacteria bacterium]|nr:ATP-binding cassette domain-containing protein [Acidobacteriota bacterium]MCB9397657.1 ATP-binding cassette domain-containing protein [Acidobacteriota bacterium]